jgi:tripartite ATP-independent transporter DctP family solute receptor
MIKTKITRRQFTASAAAAGVFAPSILRAQATVLRWSTVLAPNHPQAIMMSRIAKQVKDETAGAVEIQLFPGGQLGSSRDTVESTSSGAIQMVDEGAAIFGQFVPQISIIEAPYIWRDAQHMRIVIASPIMGELSNLLIEKRGMRLLGATNYGKRHLTTGSKAIKSADEMKGFKLRIPEVDTYRAMAEAWGARPTPLNFGELYLALSQEAVDGQENPLPTIQSAKFYEVQKFLVLTGHIITPRPIAINEKAWQGLSEKGQSAIKKAIMVHSEWQDSEILKQEAGLADVFKKAGMTVIEPDVESFRKPVLASVPAKFESKWGTGLWGRIQAAR